MNYAESQKKLDAIRREYDCKGNIIFRTALQYIVEYGNLNFRNEKWFNGCIENVDKRHDRADKDGKILWIGRDFEKAILECAREIAQIEAYDLLTYIQKEVWLGGNGISYERAIQLLKSTLDHCDTFEWEAHNVASYCGFTDDEIEELGYGYLLETEEDEYDDDEEEEE